MSADSLDPLFAYEHAIESAWQTILGNADIQAYIEASDIEKMTPFVDVQLRHSAGVGTRFVFQQGDTQVVYYNAWEGTLVSRVVTTRGKNSGLQAGLIGRIRIAGLSFKQVFTTDVLPYHQVLNVLDVGMDRGILQDQRLDWAELHLKIQFAIRPDAWPA